MPSPLTDLAKRYDSSITVLECRVLDSGGMILLLEIDCGNNSSELLRELRTTQGIRHAYWAQNGRGRVVAMVAMDAPLCCLAVRRAGAICNSCPLNGTRSRDSRWQVLMKDTGALNEMFQIFERGGVTADIREVSSDIFNDALTTRQKEIAKAAMDLGYFDFPRKIDLTKLAERLSVKPSTLAEILRRAESKMVKYYFGLSR